MLSDTRVAAASALLSCLQEADGLGQFITPWMAIAAEARNQVMPAGAGEPDEAAARACEQAAIRISLQNMLSFQWVKDACTPAG